jgi:tRNA pseudouridine38-40 synthase
MGEGGRDWGKKIRLAILCGYNGINFFGSQKNKGVRTVEEEIEKAFFKLGLISDFNFGDLKKIGWGRATRTDKRVHALLNTFSAKIMLHKSKKEMKGSSME